MRGPWARELLVAVTGATGFVGEHFPGWQPDDTETTAAAIVAALTMSRSGGPTAPHSAPSATTPWETLSAWRLGR